MGLGKLMLKSLTKSPRVNGYIIALATLPYSFAKQKEYFQNEPGATFLDSLKYFWQFIPAFLIGYVSTIVLYIWTKETDTGMRTQFGDMKKIKNLEARLLEKIPPTIPLSGHKKIKYGITNTLFLKYKTGKRLEQRAREQRNPALAIDALLLYTGSEKKIDDGYLLLKDAFTWLEGIPKLSLSGKIAYAYRDLMFRIARWLEPRNVSEYILSGVHDSILKPEKAWWWTSLGKMAADEFKLPQRTEMYVFHALLATAQQRSDAETAWNEAYSVICEQPVWERLGETRSLVRRLANTKILSQTLVFKERESREALVKEAEASATLKALIEEIDVPEPIYITREKHNGRYVSINRYISGETLYDQLKKGNKKEMPRVISILAKVHGRYPTAGYKRLNLGENLEEKLKAPEFKVTADIADSIVRHYHPVSNDLEEGTWVWNKDAHPENWIVGKKVGVLDNEGDYLIPAFFDLTNLLEYGDFFLKHEKSAYITQYITEMNEEGKKIDIATAIRSYHNATIHRMIALSSAWSSPERTRMRIYRKQALRKAVLAIDSIEQDDHIYYKHHQTDYALLREALSKLQSLIPS